MHKYKKIVVALVFILVVGGSTMVMLKNIHQSSWEEGYQTALNQQFYINFYNPNDFNCTVYGLDEMSLDPGLRDALELSKSRNNFYNIKMIADEEFLIPYPHIRVNFSRLGTDLATIDCGNLTPISKLAVKLVISPSGIASWYMEGKNG